MNFSLGIKKKKVKIKNAYLPTLFFSACGNKLNFFMTDQGLSFIPTGDGLWHGERVFFFGGGWMWRRGLMHGNRLKFTDTK